MTQQVINIGSQPNDGTGDPLRTAFQKSNGNFTELYSLVVGGGLVPIPNNTLLGNVSGSSGLPIAVTSTQLTALINQFTSVLQGIVPASGGGTTNYLRADGTWAQPPIPGGVALTPIANNTVLGNNSGSTAIPVGLASAALTALVNPFTGTTPGLVPTSVGGTGNFLRADGTFAPSGAAILTQRGVTWGVAGAPITLSSVQDVSIIIPQDSIIVRSTITTKGGVGSCQADIWATPIGAYPPTVANSIVGGNYPTISSGLTYDDSVLTSWLTALPASTAVTFHLNSTSVFTEIVLMISLARTNVTNVTGYTDGQAFSAVANSLSSSGNVKFTVSGGAISANVTSAPPSPFTGSLANSGYLQLPVGSATWMLVWGILNTTGPGPTNDFAVSFPATFSAVYGGHVTGSRNVASNGQAGNGSNFVSNLSTGGMTITVDSHAGNQYLAYWFAYGKA